MSEANGAAAGRNPDCRLDITGYICPMTFVKTKLQLEDMEAGELLALRIRKGESYNNVTRSVRDEGHAILGEAPAGEDVVELFIEKGKD
jgi:tRNA 2-thiouridine synthesizing protein A